MLGFPHYWFSDAGSLLYFCFLPFPQIPFVVQIVCNEVTSLAAFFKISQFFSLIFALHFLKQQTGMRKMQSFCLKEIRAQFQLALAQPGCMALAVFSASWEPARGLLGGKDFFHTLYPKLYPSQHYRALYGHQLNLAVASQGSCCNSGRL